MTEMACSPDIQILLLAGGDSSSIGTPKHLLPLHGEPLYVHLSKTLLEASPEADGIHISLAEESAAEILMLEKLRSLNKPIHFVYDSPSPPPTSIPKRRDSTLIDADLLGETPRIGPAAGLLAAHHYSPRSSWLVVSCDFSLVTADSLRRLLAEHEGALTCYSGRDRVEEPLLGIWSSEALRSLEGSVREGQVCLKSLAKGLDAKTVRVDGEDENVLIHVSTREDWQKALRSLDE